MWLTVLPQILLSALLLLAPGLAVSLALRFRSFDALDGYLVHADGGTIGARYRAKSEADAEETGHVYEVVDRREDATTIRVRLQDMGTEE